MHGCTNPHNAPHYNHVNYFGEHGVGGANILKVPRVGAQKHFEFSYLKYACQIGVNHKHLRVDNKKNPRIQGRGGGLLSQNISPPLPVVIVDNFLCTISSNT